jgi:tetratricopeptide (TPR) repeat protein
MAQEASVKIIRKLNEAKRELHGKNVQGCLLQFRSALEIAIAESVLPADKQAVQEEVEKLQAEIQSSSAFKQVYGPVTFAGSEFDVTLAFVRELVQASAEELFESTALASAEVRKDQEEEKKSLPEASEDSSAENSARFQAAMEKINAGQVAEAREIIAGDEGILDRVIDALNDNGISFRSSGNYDGALSCYNAGIELCPKEEGLHYNMARACFEKGDATGALRCLEAALKINPDFAPGKDLQNFIKNKAQSVPSKTVGDSESSSIVEDSNGNWKKGIMVSFKNLFGRKNKNSADKN